MLSLPKERFSASQVPATPMTWTLSIDDGTRVHQLSLGQAMQQGYNFLADGHNLIFQVAFTATGVVSYKVGAQREDWELLLLILLSLDTFLLLKAPADVRAYVIRCCI